MLARSMLLVALAAATARAQPASGEADTQFRRGRELLAAGNIGEACDAFETSEKLDPAATTLLALGVCREKNGQLATAWRLYGQVTRQLATAHDDASRQLLQAATADAAKLEPRLSKLTILVNAAARIPGLEVRRGAEVVGPDAWNQPLPIDGGPVTVSVQAPGRKPWATTITLLTESDHQTIEVPALAEPAVAPVPIAPPPAIDVPVTHPEPHRARVLPISLGVGALALGGGAIALAISGSHTYDRAKTEPDDAKQESLWHAANTRRYAAQAVGLAAVGCAGVAVWLVVRGSHEVAPPPRASWRVVPSVAPDRAGLVLTGTY